MASVEKLAHSLHCDAPHENCWFESSSASFLVFMENPTDRISLWSWSEAPQEFKDLSPHGGDEDFVAFIPGCLTDEFNMRRYIGRMASCDCYEHEIDGGLVLIGAHA